MKNIKIPLILLFVLILSFFLDKSIRNLFLNLQNQYMLQIMLFISDATSILFVIIFTLIFFLIKKRKDLLFYSIISILTSLILVFLIKFTINRPRPFEDLGISSIDGSNDPSFPSGHASRVSALIPFVWIFKNFRSFILSLLILVSISRMYLQAHYLSDVIAGSILGFYISKIFLVLSRKSNKLNKFLNK